MLGALLDGRYRLDTELRRDADGVVYAGLDARLNRPVAVTVLAPHKAADPAYLAQCRERVARLASLTHPHLVPVYDSSLEGDAPFIVTPLVSGRTLRRRQSESGPLRPDAARRVAAQAASALAALHDHGLVHGGLDPEHVMLGDDGELFLIDLARPAVADVPERVPYLAPELALGQEPDARSDVFALCAVLYEAVVGQVPFPGDGPLEQNRAKLSHVPTPPAQMLPDLPAAWSDAILLGLSASAAQRPSDGARLALRLEAVQPVGLEATQAMAPTQVMSPPPLSAPPPAPAWEPEPAPSGGAGGFLPWLALLAVLAVVGGLWFALRHPDLPAAPDTPPGATDQAAVPDVAGQSEQDATAALREAGLQVTVAARENSDTVAGGRVISQTPPAGSPPPADKLVQLVVSLGPRYVTVPQVEGLSAAEAKKILPKYGFIVSTQAADDPDRPHGTVIAQQPQAGRKVDKGSAVTLYVNQHADPEPAADAPADEPVSTPDTPPAEGGIVDGVIDRVKESAKQAADDAIDQAGDQLKQKWDETKQGMRDTVREGRERAVDGIKEKLGGQGGDKPQDPPN